MNLRFIVALTLLLLIGTSSTLLAQPGRDKDELSWDRNMSRMFAKYCHRCHNDETAQGGVNLKRDRDLKMVLDHRDVWLKVGDQLEYGNMPPQEAKQPDEKEAELMLQFVNTMVRNLQCGDRIEPGKPVVRRLNRMEYIRSVKEIVGIDHRINETLSPDTNAFGFDNIADAMSLTPTQIEQYAQAATAIVEFVMAEELNRDNDKLKQLLATNEGDFRGLSTEAADRLSFEVIDRLALKAFRRPARQADTQALAIIYQQSRSSELSPMASLGNVLRAVFISPRFLFRIEQSQPDTDQPYLVDEYDLLSRLSFFLWSAPPTDELLATAAEQDLHDPQQLRALVVQMLNAPQTREGLIERFFLQWLRLNELPSHSVDSKAFPEFKAEILVDLQLEVVETIRFHLQHGGSVADLLHSDSIWVNETLASFYGLQDAYHVAVKENATSNHDQFVRIPVGTSQRGGLLTSGAILVGTADPYRTNVPRRGNFIAGVFLGDPPPPPPPEVPELDTESGDTATMTLREKLEQHRANPQCANCHAKMDPIGFAFENFDATGRWRDTDAGKAIDASGELVDGSTFDGPEAFKQVMIQKQEQIGRHFIRQMLIYALGRGLGVGDECTVESLVNKAKDNNWQLSTIVTEIALSEPFRYRTNPDF